MKTFKVLILIIAFTAINKNVEAQSGQVNSKGNIKGVLLDKEDGLPVGFSNVVLYGVKDSILVTWTITDDKGAFQLLKVPEGKFNLFVNFIGYEKLKISNIAITSSDPDVDLGKIKLNKNAVALSEVNVVSFKNAYEVKSDKKVINVSNDISTTGGTAVDVLRNVPGLTVDADGIVNLRGSDNLSILIDGRPTSVDAKRLDQLSSADIESVELITNPSAKYNPEGKSGIINLRLKHKDEKGFNSNFLISAGNGSKYNGSAGFTFNTGKVDFFAGYDGIRRTANTSRYLLRESFFSESQYFLQQDAKTTLKTVSDKVRFGASIYINPKNSLTFSVSANPSNKADGDKTLSQYFTRQMNLLDDVPTLNSSTNKENAADYTAGYKKSFDKKGEILTADYTFTKNSSDQIQSLTYLYTDSTVDNEIRINSNNYNSNFQLNYVFPINEFTGIESGIQSIVRGTESNYQFYAGSVGHRVEDLLQKNFFSYNEQIHSVYSLLTTKYNKMNLSAGLRVEQTFINGEQLVNSEKIKNNYFNLYPSFNLLDQINSKSKLQLSYSRRINRPVARLINPYADRSNPEVLRSGNPLIKPEYVNSFEAGYTTISKSTVLGFTVFYKHINNVINSVTQLDSSGISHIFPKNFSSAENYGLETTVEHTFTKWWRINGNVSFYRTSIRGGTDGDKNSNYSYTLRINSGFTAVKKILLQITGSYSGPVVGLYSTIDPQYSVDTAIKKDFFSNKLSLTIRAMDIFNTLKSGYTAWGYNFTADNWRKQETRVVYLTMSYSFGSGKSFKSSKPETRESGPALEIY